METYLQPISEKRYQIYALSKIEHTQTAIGRIVDVHKSTGSEDLSALLEKYPPFLKER